MAKEKNINEYKLVLILQYFNLVKNSYSYQELLTIFGFTFEQLDSLLEYLLNEKYVFLKDYYQLTDKAIELLNSYDIIDSDFLTETSMDDIFTEETWGFDRIYIPKSFEKKFKK